MRVLPMGWFERIWPRPSSCVTEIYVISWFMLGLAISVVVCLFYDYIAAVRWLAFLVALVYLLAALRVSEIIVRTTTVDFTNVISRQRSLILVAINYVELMLWFGLVYALNYHSLHGASRPVTAFYFSIITQLTIGYGDVYAMGWLRIIAAAQGLIGALFVIVVLGRAVSASPTPSKPGPQ
jgi:Ion channel